MSPQIRRSVFSWKNLVAAFLCTLGIFSMAIVFTLHFRPLYYFDIDHLDIPATSGYSEEVIRRNYDELIDYNSISGPSRLTFSDFIMSEEGEIHFEEVKRILVVIVGSLVALNWDFCFVLFHKILFRNDYWIFDPACDPVITILPDAYFLHAAALILLCVLAASLFSLLLFRLLRRKISNSAK